MKNRIILSFIFCIFCYIAQAQISGGDAALCVGSSTTFSDPTSGGSWSSSDPTIANVVASSGLVTGVSAGNATITYTYGAGSFDTRNVTVSGASASCVSPICAGSSLNFSSTLNNSEPNYTYTYSWTGPNAFSSTAADPTIISATTAASGTYTLTVYSSASGVAGCTSYAIVSATVTATPVVAAVTGSTSACVGASSTLSDVTSGGTWASSATSVATVSTTGVVTGISVGTTTISYAVTNGCGTGYATTTFTVNPLPVPGASATSFVCNGGTINLTGSAVGGTPAYAYAWTGPAGYSSALQNPSISPATASSAGQYTLSVTDANGCAGSAYTSSVTVDVIPVTASSNGPVCTGGTLNLIGGPSGMTSYSWSGSSGYSSTLQSPSGIIHPTVAGTYNYSLTVTDGSGCTATAVTSITVGSPLTITVSETSPWTITGDAAYTNCSGSMMLAASGAYSGTYTWSPSGSLNASTGSSVTATNTVTTTYVVTGHYNGCVGSVSIPVLVPTTSCSPCNYFTASYNNPAATCGTCTVTTAFHTVDASTFTSANLPTDGNNNIYLATSTTMNGTFTCTGNVIFVNSGSSITIANTANVEFNNCHLFSCSWSGITVNVNSTNAGQLKLDNNTLLENAAINTATSAITVSSGSLSAPGAAAPASGNIIDCENSVLNNNSQGMNINYWPVITGTATPTTLPFYIIGSVFTGRNLTSYSAGSTSATQYYPFSWPSASTLSTLVSSSDVYNPVYGVNTYATSTVPVKGINFLGGATVTGVANIYYELVVGDVTQGINLFDNIGTYGVIASGGSGGAGNITLYNNVFLNSRGNTYNHAVLLLNSLNTYFFRLRALGAGTTYDGTYGNKFYNYFMAVGESGYGDLIGYESMIYSTMSNSSNMGTYGYYSSNTSFNNIDFEHNNLYNIYYGIYCQPVNQSGVTTYNTGDINISYNEISAGVTSSTVTNPVSWWGIAFNSNRPVVSGNTYNNVGSLAVNYNTLTKISQYGIYDYQPGTSVNYPSSIGSNTITMVNTSGTSNPIGIFDGYNVYGVIESNIISGPGYNIPTPSTAGNTYTGISAITLGHAGTFSSPIVVSCNNTHDINFGFCFSGSQDPSNDYVTWTDNVMKKESYGMYLNGTIGQQGTSTSPIDNYWEDDGTYNPPSSYNYFWTSTSGVYQTYIGAAGSPSTSELYVRNVSPQNKPTNNGPIAGTPYTSAYLPLGTTSSGYPDCTQEATLVNRIGNGNDTTGAETSINNADDQFYFLAPNPGNGNLVIRQSIIDNTSATFRVMNYTGAIVYSGNLSFDRGLARLDLRDVIKGIYLVAITDAKGTTKTFEVVIEK